MIVRDARPSGRHGSGESTVTVADLLARRPAPRIPRQRSAPSEGSSSRSSSRHRRASRRPLAIAAVGLVAAAGATVAVWQATGPDSAPTAVAALRLTTPQVAPGGTYLATASGFVPGESVRLTWTGPTRGDMGAFPADRAGQVVHGPVIERDPPGDYRIIATGLTSGHTAVTPLRVAPGAQGR